MRSVYRFGLESIKGRDNLEDLNIDKRIILKCIFRNMKGVGWIRLTQDRDKWHTLVNTVINLQLPYKVQHFMTRRTEIMDEKSCNFLQFNIKCMYMCVCVCVCVCACA
jgi:hypothetical protein